MNVHRIWVVAIMLSATNSFYLGAQDRNSQISRANDLLNERGEVVFTFEVDRYKDINSFSNKLSIDKVTDKTIKAYANKKEFDNFVKNGIEFSVVEPTFLPEEGLMSNSVEEFLKFDTYPTYDVYVQTMKKYASDYPDICKLEIIGKSTRGKDIIFLKISDNVAKKEAEPEVMYSSTMHGNETTGFPTMIRFIDCLLSNYGKDDRVDNMVDNLEMWINPLFNPDGAYKQSDQSVNGSTRANANGVDLNRNFPSPTGDAHPDGQQYQAETKVLMQFMEKHQFALSANFHGGDECVNYPWDKFKKRHVDDNWFILISREYADLVHKNSNGYMTGFNNGITNGYDWYELDGGRQDYIIQDLKGREVTVELSKVKTLAASKLADHWTYNKESLLAYFEQALYGIRGVVTDSITGEPLAANIKIIGHDDDKSVLRTEKENGDYYRMIKGGTYDVEYSAKEYKTKTFRGVKVEDFKATPMDVELVPNYVTAVDEVYEKGVFVGSAPNPFTYNTEILVELPYATDVRVEVYSVVGNLIKFYNKPNAQEGKHRFELFGNNLSEGLYTYRVITPKHVIENKLLLVK